MTQNGVWRAQNASKPSGNIINTPQSIPKHIWKLFFSGHFSPQIAQKRLSPQAPPLQATRHLLASQRVIKDPNWGLEGPKCVKTLRKHHKYPPKVSPNTFGNFFFGSFFAQKRLSPQAPPLQATRPLLASQRVIKDPKWGLKVPKCVKTIRKHHKYTPQSISKHICKLFFSGHFSPQIARKRLSPLGR